MRRTNYTQVAEAYWKEWSEHWAKLKLKPKE